MAQSCRPGALCPTISLCSTPSQGKTVPEGALERRNLVCVPQLCPSEILLSTCPQAGWGRGRKKRFNLQNSSPPVLSDLLLLLQVKGRSTATSVVPPSPRRGTCCATSSCTRGRSLSNVPSVTMLAAGVTRSPATSVHTRVSDLFGGKGGVGPQYPREIELSDFSCVQGATCLSLRRPEHPQSR